MATLTKNQQKSTSILDCCSNIRAVLSSSVFLIRNDGDYGSLLIGSKNVISDTHYRRLHARFNFPINNVKTVNFFKERE